VSARRKARELTLKALYAYDMTGTDPEQIVNDIISPSLIKPEAKKFSQDLFLKVVENIEQIDNHIKKNSRTWDFSRIATIEKNLLRMGICEFLFFDDIPASISIDEAIELAKRYAEKDSKNFVNAVLDSVLKNLERKQSERR
jgi:transcription antitermination factor NusB